MASQIGTGLAGSREYLPYIHSALHSRLHSRPNLCLGDRLLAHCHRIRVVHGNSGLKGGSQQDEICL